jgi:hypothetical protein
MFIDMCMRAAADYARWQQLRDSNTHTDETLERLDAMTSQLINNITSVFGNIDKNWNFPKMANMRKYADAIKEIGMISISDTGPKEALNKSLRASYNNTNKKLSGLTQQVAQKVQLGEALQQAAAANATAPSHAKAPTGAVSDRNMTGLLLSTHSITRWAFPFLSRVLQAYDCSRQKHAQLLYLAK